MNRGGEAVAVRPIYGYLVIVTVEGEEAGEEKCVRKSMTHSYLGLGLYWVMKGCAVWTRRQKWWKNGPSCASCWVCIIWYAVCIVLYSYGSPRLSVCRSQRILSPSVHPLGLLYSVADYTLTKHSSYPGID